MNVTARGDGPTRQARRTAARLRAARAHAWPLTGHQGSTGSAWLWVTGLAVLLAVVWAVVVAGGGSRTALPHLFYLPIIAATVPFGLRGSIVVALLATVLAGPLTPLSTGTGEGQAVASWVVRGVAFLAVGTVACLPLALRERTYAEQLGTEVRRALVRASRSQRVDGELVAKVGGVLARRAFQPVYQPIYSFADGRLVAVEALTRFTAEPRRPPDQWFAAAQEAGLGTELEIAAMSAALEGAVDLPPGVVVSVNASPTTLADPRVLGLLSATPSRRVLVEITEHAAIEDYPLLAEQVGALRDGGIHIAVDDAGAGFASLRHIVQLAPDVIKLDMSLTQHVESSPLRRALAASLIEFAQGTGAMLIVEGVEAQPDLEAWCSLGADAVQGYLVGRPGPLPAPRACRLVTALPGRHGRRGRPGAGRLDAGRALA